MPFPSECRKHRWLPPIGLRGSFFRPAIALAISFLFAGLPLTTAFPGPPKSGTSANETSDAPKADCELNSARGDIKHVVYIQFGHLHLTRDIPNVPSDLEQMPHLFKFLESNGTLLTNHHTALLSQPANDGLTSLTGVYPERHGASFASSSTYWTTRVDPNTSNSGFRLFTTDGKNVPAPWVPFTRAGCNVGAVAIGSMALENTGQDILTAFGANSLETALSVDPATSTQAAADFEGIAIHCGASNSLCSFGRPDVLPDEPRGYQGFNALFGYKSVAPMISPNGPLKDLDGKVIADAEGNLGFPGVAGISAAQSLAFVAAMQEHSVPVTYAYISDAHENHSGTGAFGSGEAAYVAQLKAYDEAFDKFFTRLAADGINQNNTLFVVTADEGDHFVGGPPVPSTCDGVNVPCTYPKLGEIAVNVSELLTRQDPKLANTPFEVQAGMAPAFYIKGNPAPDSQLARQLEKAAAKLSAVNPVTGNADQLTLFLADAVEMKLLHMVPTEASRTPNLVLFGHPDHLFQTSGMPFLQNRGVAWNHGGVAPEVNTTFVGLVGPGINAKGVQGDIWSDHTDIRPTMLALLGLQDDYLSQGRALTELFHEWALPSGVRDSGDQFLQLAQAYKRINAPIAELGLTSLRISTAALVGDDAKYNNLEDQLNVITALRDDLASAMANLLDAGEFHGRRISEGEARQLVRSANDLVEYVKLVAANGW